MDRQALIRKLLDEYAQKQVRNRSEAARRLEEAIALDPQIGTLRANAFGIASSALSEGMKSKAADWESISSRMKLAGKQNSLEIKRRLAAAGLPEDYLEEKYECPICHDTGYVPDTFPSRFCECFEKRLRQELFADGTMAGLDQENFSKYDEDLVARANPDNARDLVGVRYFCEKYAMDYPSNALPNIILCGAGGVGKTFLLNCVFERVVSRGFSGVRLTAYRLFELMRKKHMGEDSQSFEDVISAPLLIIDDLGSEPMFKNITVEYLFTLLNERLAANRHTLIATNLSHNKLQERYGERVASRLFDTGRTTIIIMNGSDLRKERGK